MPKRLRRAAVRPVTRAELRAIQRALAELRSLVNAQGETLAHVQKLADTNFRRCAELQLELDRLKKLIP